MFSNVIHSCDGKVKFSASILNLASHDPSEIILMCWFVDHETFLIIVTVENCDICLLLLSMSENIYHLFEIEIFCDIINVFTVYPAKKSINYLLKNRKKNHTDPIFWTVSLVGNAMISLHFAHCWLLLLFPRMNLLYTLAFRTPSSCLPLIYSHCINRSLTFIHIICLQVTHTFTDLESKKQISVK